MAFSSFSSLPGIAAVALLIGALPAASQNVDPDIIAAQTGIWLVAPLDGKPGCRLTFTADETIGGHAVTGAEACETPLPAMAQAYAWNFGDSGLNLTDPTRKVIASFRESEGSPMQSAEPPLALVKAPDGIDRLPTQAALAGTWVMKRPDGEILCTVELKPATRGEENGTLSPSGACADAVTRLKLEYWQISAFDLVLMASDGGSLSFTLTGGNTFAKSAHEGGKPLALVRP